MNLFFNAKIIGLETYVDDFDNIYKMAPKLVPPQHMQEPRKVWNPPRVDSNKKPLDFGPKVIPPPLQATKGPKK